MAAQRAATAPLLRGGNFTLVPGQHVPDLHAVLNADSAPLSEPLPTAPTAGAIETWAATVAAATPLTL